MPSIDRDYEIHTQLEPYSNSRDALGVMEWLEPDPEIEDQFSQAYGVCMDTSVQPPVLVFEFTPPEYSDDPGSIDAIGILSMITGEDLSGIAPDEALQLAETLGDELRDQRRALDTLGASMEKRTPVSTDI